MTQFMQKSFKVSATDRRKNRERCQKCGGVLKRNPKRSTERMDVVECARGCNVAIYRKRQ